MPNFSFLVGLEVGETFVLGGGVVEHVTSMSNSNASCFRVELRWVLTISIPKCPNFLVG